MTTISRCLFFHVFLILTIVFHSCLKGQGGLGKSATTNPGPNDAGHVVWAISKIF